ncbi:MAG: DUF3301 domain-containing protein [Salinisphaeraceae bacterium]|uniref:DUF3301 domain-containing protein n=2 Tax=Spectribacter TaxID=3160928 RepID=A0ABU3BVX8_9GAMM|nr:MULTISPECIES: DUF3301 domain-containing protein [unclassified Salinisphaera]MDT0618186.1 DUF3301 domain-containing protein [Salinisphaera sp. P385]MDT0633443.1 DUF3301 domain-containing protein [Salinisphaera sp. W335]
MNNLLWLLGFALLGLAWWSALGARARARDAARRACAEAEVMYIDEIHLRALRPGRDRRGRATLRRTYGFEFYVRGERRYAGSVVLHGRRVADVDLDPHPL